MCQAIRELREESMNAGLVKGEAIGIAKGEAKGKVKAYAEMVSAGLVAPELAAEMLHLSVEEFLQQAGLSLQKN